MDDRTRRRPRVRGHAKENDHSLFPNWSLSVKYTDMYIPDILSYICVYGVPCDFLVMFSSPPSPAPAAAEQLIKIVKIKNLARLRLICRGLNNLYIYIFPRPPFLHLYTPTYILILLPPFDFSVFGFSKNQNLKNNQHTIYVHTTQRSPRKMIILDEKKEGAKDFLTSLPPAHHSPPGPKK